MGCAPSALLDTDGDERGESRVALLEAEVRRLEAEAEMLRAKLVDLEQTGLKRDQQQARRESGARRRIPVVGDHVVSHHVKHAYYTARVVEFDAAAREFVVAWDDGDASGTRQPYDKVCLNDEPGADDVAVSTIVMFPQGKYQFSDQSGAVRQGLDRYHEGKVVRVERDGTTGEKLYVGMHTRSELDGKWCTYAGHAPTFRCTLPQLRVAANLLDLLDNPSSAQAAAGAAGADAKYDIYMSFTLQDAETARRLGDARGADPTAIAAHFEQAGWRVYCDARAAEHAEASVVALASASVCVACISDAFAANTHSRQELQYAKKTLKKPVVPLIVGDAAESWDFMNTLVGLLIAGDLYIDFRARAKHAEKLADAVGVAVREGVADDAGADPVDAGA